MKNVTVPICNTTGGKGPSSSDTKNLFCLVLCEGKIETGDPDVFNDSPAIKREKRTFKSETIVLQP